MKSDECALVASEIQNGEKLTLIDSSVNIIGRTFTGVKTTVQMGGLVGALREGGTLELIRLVD